MFWVERTQGSRQFCSFHLCFPRSCFFLTSHVYNILYEDRWGKGLRREETNKHVFGERDVLQLAVALNGCVVTWVCLFWVCIYTYCPTFWRVHRNLLLCCCFPLPRNSSTNICTFINICWVNYWLLVHISICVHLCRIQKETPLSMSPSYQVRRLTKLSTEYLFSQLNVSFYMYGLYNHI